MTASNLQLKIDGTGVSPETVQLRDLIDLLDEFEQAVQATAKGQAGLGSPLISLIAIGDGSDRLTLFANDKAMRATATIAHAIELRDASRIPAKAEEHVRKIWKRMSDRDWSLGIVNSDFKAIIEPKQELFAISRVKGQTSISGFLQRVGGIGPTAQLYLDRGSIITINLAGEEMAKALGHKLYDFIALEGEASWLVPAWSLDTFRAQRILPVTTAKRDAVEMFRTLVAAGPSAWDDIDPDDFVNEQRADATQ